MSNVLNTINPSVAFDFIQKNGEIITNLFQTAMEIEKNEEMVLHVLNFIKTLCEHDITLKLKEMNRFRFLIEINKGCDFLEQITKHPNNIIWAEAD